MVTSVTDRARGEPTQLLIERNTAEGEESGLLHDSAVKCEHLLTLHRSFVSRVIGRLPAKAMEKIDECLKESLGLA
jgi:mRNA-degrading endonuclease toxin of MazEF toxin-antitoxin module